MPKTLKKNIRTPNKIDEPLIHPVMQKALGYCLQKAAQRSRSLLDAALQPYGLLTYQYAIIKLLVHSGPYSQIEIGNYLSIDKASIVRFLDGLEEQGHITRTPCKQDRRIKNVTITNKGIRMYEVAEKLKEKVQEEFLSPLTIEERKAYAVIIPKLIKGT